MLFTALQSTFLKKSLDQASSLPDNQKVAVLPGVSYDVESYEEVAHDDHFHVSLKWGQGDWVIWTPHWDLGRTATDIVVPSVIDWNDMNCKISKYFTVGEVTNHNPHRIPQGKHRDNVISIAKELDKIREEVGALRTTSWMRPSRADGYPVEINRAVGGATRSQHRWGLGVDVYPMQGNLAGLQSTALSHWRGGVGRGLRRGFLHLDGRNGFPCWREGKPTVAWDY